MIESELSALRELARQLGMELRAGSERDYLLMNGATVVLRTQDLDAIWTKLKNVTARTST